MNCKNCNTALIQENQFCSNCGEKTDLKRLTVKLFISNFFNHFFSLDNKLIKTLKDLFLQPDVVIESYIKGFRRKYVNVIPYLGLTLTLIGLQFFILKKFFPELMVSNFNSKQLQGESFESVMAVILEYQGLIAAASIPFYGVISRLVFIDSKKYNIAEHLVIVTYSSAHIYIITFFVVLASLPFGINFLTTSNYIGIPSFIYMVFIYKRLYQFSWKSSFFRALGYVLSTILFVMIAAVMIGLIYAFFIA